MGCLCCKATYMRWPRRHASRYPHRFKALSKHGLIADSKFIATVSQLDERADAAGYRAAQTLLRESRAALEKLDALEREGEEGVR